jgi:hypothetical protein
MCIWIFCFWRPRELTNFKPRFYFHFMRQKADMHYNCGTSTNIQWTWNQMWGPGHPNAPVISSKNATEGTDDDLDMVVEISYGAPYMYSWRGSKVTIIGGPKGTPTTIEMVGEKPMLQYNFVIKTEARKVLTGWS